MTQSRVWLKLAFGGKKKKTVIHLFIQQTSSASQRSPNKTSDKEELQPLRSTIDSDFHMLKFTNCFRSCWGRKRRSVGFINQGDPSPKRLHSPFHLLLEDRWNCLKRQNIYMLLLCDVPTSGWTLGSRVDDRASKIHGGLFPRGDLGATGSPPLQGPAVPGGSPFVLLQVELRLVLLPACPPHFIRQDPAQPVPF